MENVPLPGTIVTPVLPRGMIYYPAATGMKTEKVLNSGMERSLEKSLLYECSAAT
jgi:hypothetical protein